MSGHSKWSTIKRKKEKTDNARAKVFTKLQKVYKNYKAIVQYFVENGKARARIIGNNTTNFNLAKSDAYTLTLIPFNELLGDTQIGHYVKSSDDAEKLSVYYRVGDTNYDHFTPPVKQWAYAPLELTSLRYFGQDLNDIYVAKIPLGYTYDRAGNESEWLEKLKL